MSTTLLIGPHPGRRQPRLQPRRRRADLDVGEDPRAEARAQIRHLDGYRAVILDRPLSGRLGIGLPRRGREIGTGDGVQLPGDAVDAEAVDPVGGRLELDHRLAHREDCAERGPRGGIGLQDHDPVVVLADLDLTLREDHPVGLDPAELGLLQLLAARHPRARGDHGDRLARGDVGRPADDRLG